MSFDGRPGEALPRQKEEGVSRELQLPEDLLDQDWKLREVDLQRLPFAPIYICTCQSCLLTRKIELEVYRSTDLKATQHFLATASLRRREKRSVALDMEP